VEVGDQTWETQRRARRGGARKTRARRGLCRRVQQRRGGPGCGGAGSRSSEGGEKEHKRGNKERWSGSGGLDQSSGVKHFMHGIAVQLNYW
jgi:hypothetical protein